MTTIPRAEIQAVTACGNCGELIIWGVRGSWVHTDGSVQVADGAENCISLHAGTRAYPSEFNPGAVPADDLDALADRYEQEAAA